MPRHVYSRQRRKLGKWNKRDIDDGRHEDGSGDHLRSINANILRRDQGGGGRRSFHSDVIRRAVAMNLLPTPSGSSPGSNSGLAVGESWARITIIFGGSYPLDVMQELVNTALGTQLRFYNVWVEERNIVMYAKIRQKLVSGYQKSLQTLRDPSDNKALVGDITLISEPRVPSVATNFSPGPRSFTHSLPEPWMESLRRCFAERFQPTTRNLDLSSLHTDPTLLSQGLYLPLNRTVVVHALVSILRDNAAQLNLLSLANNRLHHLNALSPLAANTDEASRVVIERIDLSGNPLYSFSSLAGLRGIAGLTELDISDTPAASQFNQSDRKMAVNLMKVLPSLKRLNGEDLPQAVHFAIEQASSSPRVRLPVSSPGCFPNDEVRVRLLCFLKEYFSRYDSKPRAENLLPYYTSASLLVLSVIPDLRSGQHHAHNPIAARMDSVAEDGTKLKVFLTSSRLSSVYFQKSRNLLHCGNETRRRELVARGSVQCSALLGELPPTEHLLDSLSVDVAFNSPTEIIFTVAGVFYEVQSYGVADSDGHSLSSPSSQSVRKTLRCFSRTMIMIAPGGHIVQDDYIISNPSIYLCKKYITNVASKARSAKSDTTPIVPLPQPVTNQPSPNADTQASLVNQIRQLSGMNEAFSRQCLVEYQWDINSAFNCFQTLFAAGKVPPQAFG